MSLDFTEDQFDALRELANMGMGRTAHALGQLLELEVIMNIPRVEFVPVSALMGQINEWMSLPDTVATRQAFSQNVDGEALLIFEVRPTLCVEGSADELDDEQMLEVTNIMVCAFLGSLLEPLGADLYFSPPSLVAASLNFQRAPLDWDVALVLNIEMGTHGHLDNCKLMLVFPERSIGTIRVSVGKLLERL